MISAGLLALLPNDQTLLTLLSQNWLIGVLIIAGIVFCETGLVVMPFLPGDSMLFATGAFLGISGISPVIPILILVAAAFLGDAANYLFGNSLVGNFLIRRGWVRPAHLDSTRRHFDKHGSATIIIGRFIPVVRTMAPFFAGLTAMNRSRFFAYDLMGSFLWCGGLVLSGYWLSEVSWVRAHMVWLSIGIVLLSSALVLIQARCRILEHKG